jgi:pilus assembly protein CpaF
MFTIIINEKGGTERRESFDKNEINVGRVQGNDLMLPKGNVSKHHARLLYRDGRFIVTDLKSTNGTYVNGRKISQATIVREGDKIYVGDFVLRLETSAAVAADESLGRTPSRPKTAPREPPPPPPLPPVPTREPTREMSVKPPPLPSPHATGHGSPAATAAVLAVPPAPPVSGVPPPLPPQVSHYPLERDPDSESAPEMIGTPVPRVPGPPRVPNSDSVARGAGAAVDRGTPPRRPASAALPRPVRQAPVVEPRPVLREQPHHAARRLALITLVDRVADVVDLEPLDNAPDVDENLAKEIERAVQEQATAMRGEGEAPEGVDIEVLVRDALREFLGLGPIGPLLEDDDVLEIHVTRPDRILVLNGERASLAETTFSSDEALARIVARLAREPGETRSNVGAIEVVERRLPRGARLVAMGPGVANGWVLSVRKRRRVEGSLDDLVRSAALSRSMAVFLETCVAARANLLVVGSGAGAVSWMLAGLASAITPGERVAVLSDGDDIVAPQAQANVITLPGAGAGVTPGECVRAAARLGFDRIVVTPLADGVALATIEAIGEGSEGVLAGVAAPSLRQAIARLAAHVAMARAGASVEAAREAIGESFDVAVEVARGPAGALHVLRVAELDGADNKGVVCRDLFVARVDREGKWDFGATGTSPRLAQDFAARGIRLDPALFAAR